MKIKSHTITIEIGSRYFDRSCKVRALVLDGQPNIYHITESQKRSAKKRCGITGSDYLVRYGDHSDTRLLVIGDNPDEIEWC